MFPEPRDQAKAIGVYGFVASAGGSIGLLAGGVLTESINWHWIFFINIPIGIATAVLAQRLIPADEGIGLTEGADVPGALLVTAHLMLGVYTIVKPAAEHGWLATETLLFATGSLLLLALFVVREATAAKPLFPLRILRSRNLSGANVVQMLAVAGMFGMFFLGALYLERVLRYDALEIGLAFLPATIVMGTMSLRYAERLSARFGERNVMIPGLTLVAIGLLLFSRAPVDGEYVRDVLPVMLVLGLGIGAAFPPLMGLAMSGVQPHEAGLASGLVNTAAQVGGALGLAVLATLSATRSDDLRAEGSSAAEALTSGYHLAFVVAAGLVLLSVVVTATVFRSPDPAPSATPQPAAR
jgi:MFS family permease